MEKTQKIIVALLILAIVFSVISIIVSMGALNVRAPESAKATGYSVDNTQGQVRLVVERNNLEGVG